MYSSCSVVHNMTVSWNCIFFFFNDTATTEIYTLSLHDALPIWGLGVKYPVKVSATGGHFMFDDDQETPNTLNARSEEHTSELQSQSNLVCRLLLEKQNNSIHTRNKCP